jgi:hypothetical protein
MSLVRGACRCGATWVGLDRCHCSRCHQTWDDIRLYDRHQRVRGCLAGPELGLLATRNGIWLRPEDLAAAS